MEVIFGLTTLPHVAYKMVLSANWDRLNMGGESGVLNKKINVLNMLMHTTLWRLTQLT